MKPLGHVTRRGLSPIQRSRSAMNAKSSALRPLARPMEPVGKRTGGAGRKIRPAYARTRSFGLVQTG